MMSRGFLGWMIEPIRKYKTLDGRSRRAEFWWFFLFQLIVTVISIVLDVAIFGTRESDVGPVNGVATLLLIIPYCAVGVRRLHDIDRSGWWMFLPFAGLLPLVALPVAALAGQSIATLSSLVFILCGLGVFGLSILMLVWCCIRGTVGDNRFGPDPLECEA